MARQTKQGIENNFIKGLITETTAIKFPKDACTETFNCVFDEVGKVTRRFGLDLEPSAAFSDLLYDEDAAFTEFVWNAVRGEGERSFLCTQRGKTIEFYDISSSVTTVSSNKKTFSVDLSAFVPSGSSLDPATNPCKYAQGNGNLVIVNKACNPVLVVYNDDEDTITSSAVELLSRDFTGAESGLEAITRPTATVTSIKSDNPAHYYNLLNQGWHAVDALSQWDTARSDLPSDADTVGLYRASATDAFDSARVLANSPGNSSAPKGHFILNVFNPDRTQAMIDEGFTGAAVGGSSTLINNTNISVLSTDAGTNSSNLIDDNAGTSATSSIVAIGGGYSAAYLTVNFQLASPTRISSLKFPNGYTQGAFYPVISVYLQAKVNIGDAWTTLGTATSVTTIASNDNLTQFNYFRISLATGSVSSPAVPNNFTVPEIDLYESNLTGAIPPLTYTRPSNTAFFAGRAWYAGINGLDLNNTVFFSQIIQNNKQYGLCHQANDPTSEDFPDLLQDDGGYIKIPGMATVTHIGNFHNALLVFATNGVWAVSGSNKQYFTATSYGVRKISGVGTSSTTSFADVKGIPYWWGESGIYTVNYDPNYDAYEVVSLSDSSIFSFFNDIPSENRRYVKASYNIDNETITWLYNSASSLGAGDKYKYDRALIFNTLSRAFYPWTISTGASFPSIRGVVHVRAALDASSSITKYMTSDPEVNPDQSTFISYSFAEASDTTYTDWPTYDDGADYQSYFITGHTIDGGLMRKSSPGYVMVYMEEEANAGAFARGIFDWTTSAVEGKTTNSQQLYLSSLSNRTVKARKLRFRGSGVAMQFKIESETSKPFTIVGWAHTISTEGRV